MVMESKVDFPTRFAKFALSNFGKEGPFSIDLPKDDYDRAVSAFQALGCSVELNPHRLSVRVVPPAGQSSRTDSGTSASL